MGWVFAGEWLKYTVNVTQSTTYRLRIRVASQGQGGTFHLEVDGSNRTGSLTVPDTGNWLGWVELQVNNLALIAGTHVLRISMDSVGAAGDMGNIDWLDFVPTALATKEETGTDGAASGAGGCGLTGLETLLFLLALRRLRRKS